jgi:hypothetical protein
MNIYRSSISTDRTMKPNISQYAPEGLKVVRVRRFKWINRIGEGIVKPLKSRPSKRMTRGWHHRRSVPNAMIFIPGDGGENKRFWPYLPF